MRFSLRTLKFLVLLAAAMLVLNDVSRLVFSPVQQAVASVLKGEANEDDNNAPTTLFEEEVKHKDTPQRLYPTPLLTLPTLDAAIVHLIRDDDVRHQAFIPIFSPPPDRA